MKRVKQLPKIGKWNRKLWEEFQANKDEIVEAMFNKADKLDLSNEELAVKAKVSRSTVYNLVDYTTSSPHLATIWKLAQAVGLELEIKTKKEKRKSKSKSKIKLYIA